MADIAAIGLCRDDAHNYYWNGEGPLPSPTTIAKVVAAGWALDNWRMEQRVRIAVRDADLLVAMRDRGESEGAVAYVMGAREDRTAADRGTSIHEWAEHFNRGDLIDAPPDHAAECSGYAAWSDDAKPKWLLVEEMVANLTEGYAGTLDGIAEIGGETWLLDIKTGSTVAYRGRVKEDYRLQLAAYSLAEFWGRPGDPETHEMPRIDRTGIVHVTSRGSRLVDANVTDADRRAFLAALRLHNWRKGEAA